MIYGTGEKEKWFESISSFVFSPETCSNACSMKGLHPICFGYMLNYNYLGNPHSFVMSDVGKDNGDNDNNADGEKDLGKSDDFITDGLDNSRNEIDDHANEVITFLLLCSVVCPFISDSITKQ